MQLWMFRFRENFNKPRAQNCVIWVTTKCCKPPPFEEHSQLHLLKMDSMSFLIVYYDMACIDFSIALSLVGVPVTTMGHQANACIDG